MMVLILITCLAIVSILLFGGYLLNRVHKFSEFMLITIDEFYDNNEDETSTLDLESSYNNFKASNWTDFNFKDMVVRHDIM
jgi:hypothetical protein